MYKMDDNKEYNYVLFLIEYLQIIYGHAGYVFILMVFTKMKI